MLCLVNIQLFILMMDATVPISLWTILPVVFSFIAAVGAPIVTIMVKAIVQKSKEEILYLMEAKYVTKELFNSRMETVDVKLKDINEDVRDSRRDNTRREDRRIDDRREDLRKEAQREDNKDK